MHIRDELADQAKSADVEIVQGKQSGYIRARLPFLRVPQSQIDGPWLQEEHEASAWLSLFYDLAVVAVLTVFSTTHELATPSAIPIFFSYYAVISWLWISQVHYDIRYQAEDAFHRFVKGLQITIFVYIGAASGNWNLNQLRNPTYLPEVTGREVASHQAAEDSFYTIVIAFIASRALLAFQYLIAACLGWRAERRIQAQIWSASILGISMVFSVVAVALPNHTHSQVFAKVFLFYTSIGMEIIGVWIQHRRKLHWRIKTEAIGERYGALTLIILGEGFISLTRAFNRAISGLSESNSATYLQVFISIAIIYLLYLFLFGRQRKDDEVEQERALFWELTHIPLHFALLLLLAAMVNTVIVISYAHGINTVTNQFSTSIDYIKNGSSLGVDHRRRIETYLDRLTLEPSYEKEYEYLDTLSKMAYPPDDPTLLGYQYFGQIILQTTISYGIEISENVLSTFEHLYAIETTWTANQTLRDIRQEQASQLLIDVIQAPVDEALSGVLWLFPCAGVVLILCGIRSMIWYNVDGAAHYLLHLPMFIAGTGLALLALLDIGSRDIDVLEADELLGTNPLYQLLSRKLPLIIVMVVYLAVYACNLTIAGDTKLFSQVKTSMQDITKCYGAALAVDLFTKLLSDSTVLQDSEMTDMYRFMRKECEDGGKGLPKAEKVKAVLDSIDMSLDRMWMRITAHRISKTSGAPAPSSANSLFNQLVAQFTRLAEDNDDRTASESTDSVFDRLVAQFPAVLANWADNTDDAPRSEYLWSKVPRKLELAFKNSFQLLQPSIEEITALQNDIASLVGILGFEEAMLLTRLTEEFKSKLEIPSEPSDPADRAEASDISTADLTPASREQTKRILKEMRSLHAWKEEFVNTFKAIQQTHATEEREGRYPLDILQSIQRSSRSAQ